MKLYDSKQLHTTRQYAAAKIQEEYAHKTMWAKHKRPTWQFSPDTFIPTPSKATYFKLYIKKLMKI